MLPLEHPNRIQIAFDDHRLVNNAGLLLPATLGKVGRRRVTPCYRSTSPSTPFRTGRATFTASGSPVPYPSPKVSD